MPTPKQSKVIAVTCTNANDNTDVIAYNRTTGEKITAKASSNKAVFDMANFSDGWSTGDVIEFRVNGAYFGSATATLTAASAKQSAVSITLTQTTTTNAPAISF